MSKHTTAPWHVGMRNGHNACHVYAYNGKDQYSDAGICSVYGLPMHRKLDELEESESFANARLIAAAPELLEALKNMVESFGGRADAHLTNDKNVQSVNQARAAIAKAEGK